MGQIFWKLYQRPDKILFRNSGSIYAIHFKDIIERSPWFLKKIDGYPTQLGDLIIQVSEHSISTTFNLPIDGETWFKKKEISKGFYNQFLTEDHQDPDWSKGTPNTWLKEEWKNSLPVFQKYITCEGRFSKIHCWA
jgi:hypothetical protein